MSTQSSQNRRRRRSAPPPRLSWPAGTLSQQPVVGSSQPNPSVPPASSSTQPNSNNNNSNQKPAPSRQKKRSPPKNKRKRTLTFDASTKNGSYNNNNDNSEETANQMWVDQYAPNCRQELCIAAKKVNEVASWLEQHQQQKQDSQQQNSQQPTPPREKLLILVGKPGTGKSTMMRTLAAESNTKVLEWSDSYSNSYSHDSYQQLESLSPLNSFAQFLQQSGAGFASLDLQLQSSSSFSALEQQLAKSSSSPQKKQSSTNTKADPSSSNQLILLEELPNLANTESQERFREMLTQHVQTTQVPTIWIYSEGTEGQHKPADLERHVRPDVLYDGHVKILNINPVTRPMIKKCLDRIAKSQNFKVTKDFCERLQLQSGGDIRYAINALQFDQSLHQHQQNINDNNNSSSSKVQKGKRSKLVLPEATSSEHERDTQWTAFHALGKLLYAKREPAETTTTTIDNGERPPLTFDPEQVLEHCDMDLGHALTYLGFHSVDFFTDVEELSTALDLYSDASFLLEQTTNYNYKRRSQQQYTTTVSCPIFPEGYVSSLAGRAIAHANQHPAPSKFRSLSAPKVLDIRRKRNDNSYHLARLQHRLSRLSIAEASASSARNSTGSASLPSFVMDQLPFLRKIVPNDVNASLDQLHTSGSEHADRFFDQQNEEEALAAMQEQQQQAILNMDDIDEFDSDNDDDDKHDIQATQQPHPYSQQSVSTTHSLSQPNPQGNQVATNPGMKSCIGKGQLVEQPPKALKPVTKIVNPYKKSKKTASAVNNQASRSGTASTLQGGHVPERRPSFHNPYANKKKAGSNTATTVHKKPKSEPTEMEMKPRPQEQELDDDSLRRVGDKVLMDV